MGRGVPPPHRKFLNLCHYKWHVLIDFMRYEQLSAVNRNASIKTRIQATKPDDPDSGCPGFDGHSGPLPDSVG